MWSGLGHLVLWQMVVSASKRILLPSAVCLKMKVVCVSGTLTCTRLFCVSAEHNFHASLIEIEVMIWLGVQYRIIVLEYGNPHHILQK